MKNELSHSLPSRFREDINEEELYELRIYKGQPITAVTKSGLRKLRGGSISPFEFELTLNSLCKGSQYVYDEQIKKGFFTLHGCRIGVCGSAITEKGEITSIKNIRSLNIRFARQIKGCAKELFSLLGNTVTGGLLLAGAPACGKTTLLRDLTRLISDSGKKVCVVDERSEISALSDGISPMDLGSTTDILDGYPKTKAIEIALRCLSPQVIVCDEIGEKDADSIISCANCGVDIIAAIHSDGRFSCKLSALCESGAFSRVAFFQAGAVGKIERIVDLDNAQICFSTNCRTRDIFTRPERKPIAFYEG